MATVFNRIYGYCKVNKKRMLTLEQRQAVGKVVVQSYISSGGDRLALKRVEAPEYDGDFQVLYYPKEFTPQMDEVIDNFYKEIILKSWIEKTNTSKEKRKRILIKK